MVEGGVSQKNIAQLSSALGRLQSSSASRERAKVYVMKHVKSKARKVAESVATAAKKSGVSAPTAEQFKKKILGIADEN